MEFLRQLAQIRFPLLDRAMSLITALGEEALFIVIALTFFWCVDKKRGYYLLFIGFTGTVINQFLKMAFRIPRPWVLDPEFQIVESAREQATGYSFPSGHTSNATTLYGGIARSAKKRAVQITGIALVLLIAFSRMYLGVHTPLDVITSLCIGAALTLALFPVINRAYQKPWAMLALIGGVLTLALANLIFLYAFRFPSDVDVQNLAHAKETGWKMLGLVIAMCAVYPLDTFLIKFDTKAVWWAQILKVTVGFALTMAVRSLLKAPLNSLMGEYVGGAVRYCIMVLVAGAAIPSLFRFLPKPKSKESK